MRLLPVAMASLLSLSALLSGCLSGTGPDDADGPDKAPEWNGHSLDAPLSAWLHDISQPIKGFANVTEHYRTLVPGITPEGPGVELDTWIIRPDIEDPVPILLEVTPYYTGGEPAGLGRVGAELLARGYAVGVSSVRGTGNSGGCFTQGGPQEAHDTAAVVEHVAAQSWSNGNVGIMGVSYPGTTPQDVWVEAPPSLKTIVPISGISDLYKYTFVHGVPISGTTGFNTYYWALEGPATADPTDVPTVPGAIAGEVCTDQLDVQSAGGLSYVNGDKTPYWQARDFAAEYWAKTDELERASVFYIHGLGDWNVKTHNMEDWLEVYEDSGVPMKIWLGQWPHAWPASSGTSEASRCYYDNETLRGETCRADWWNTTLVAWLDQWLKGIDTGIMDAPKVQVQDDDRVWRHEASWPPKDAEIVEFHLHGDGTMGDGPGDGVATYEVAALGGESQQPPARLEFRSEPVTQNMTASGFPTFAATVTPTGARASLLFSLGEELPDGSVRWINHGALSLNHAESLEQGNPNVAGLALDVDLKLFPQDDVIHEGSRIVLSFGSNTIGSPGPGLRPSNDPGTITIDLSTAMLHIPVDRTTVPEDPQPYVGPRPPAVPQDDCFPGVILCT